jgi:hypothetical protein
MARDTVDKINYLSTIAFGEGGKSNSNMGSQETDALSSLLLDFLRQNIKLQDNIYIKDGKDSL